VLVERSDRVDAHPLVVVADDERTPSVLRSGLAEAAQHAHVVRALAP